MSRNWKALLPLAVLALLGVFWLPWHIPTTPNISDSYIFGFNNQVSWLFLLLFIALFVLLGPRIVLPGEDDNRIGRSALHKALFGTLLASGIMYLLERPVAGYGEGVYFCDRIRELIAGHTPYLGFEFAYGPALLYVPAGLTRFFHLDVRDAYGVTYILSCLSGTALLWTSCNWVQGSLAGRRFAFYFFWAASLVSTLNYGLNYSLLRFILPVFGSLLVYKLARGRGASDPAPYTAIVIAFVATTLISPELGIASASGSVLCLAIMGWLRPVRSLVFLGLTLVALAVFFLVANKLGLYRTMFAIRGGFWNFPVLPGVYILLFLVAAAVTGSIVGTYLRSGRSGTALPLLCYGLPASAAAFGRCDGGHVLLNGLPMFLCGIIFFSRTRLFGRVYLWALCLAYALPFAVSTPSIIRTVRGSFVQAVFALEPRDSLTNFDLMVLRNKQRQFGAERGKTVFNDLRAGAQENLNPDFYSIYKQPQGTVFDVPVNFEIEDYGLYQSPVLDAGYFMGMTDVGTERQVQEKISELRDHSDRPLLLPPWWEAVCHSEIEADVHLIRHLLFFPFRHKIVHEWNIGTPFCTYVKEHYKQVSPADAAHLRYGLWIADR